MPIDPRVFAGPNIGEIMAQAQARAQDQDYRQQTLDLRRSEMEDQQNRRQQLADLLPRAMGGEAKALQGLAGVDPEAYGRIQTQQRQSSERSTEALSRIASVVRRQPYEQRRAALQRMAPALSQYGITAEQLQSFDPTDEQLDAYVALSGQRDAAPTDLQRNVDYYRSIGRNDLAEQYLTNRADPLVNMDINGDGLPDIAPRSAVTARINGGGAQPQAQEQTATNPQTGQRIRLNPQTGQWEPIQGGASPNGSRPFP
jgi:hypothetical protein